MLAKDQKANDANDELLNEIVAGYLREVEAGVTPNRGQLVEQYPHLKDALRDFFAHCDQMDELLDPLRSAAAHVLNIRCPHCHHAIEFLDDLSLCDLNCPSCGSNFSLVAPDGIGEAQGSIKRLGQFQLIERAGLGQFGSVWKAQDLTLERMVAIKIPRRGQLTTADVEIFLRDARLSAQLNHPNIVGVHEVGKQDDTIYIVSDFIQGQSLKECIVTTRMTHREVAELCIKIASGLEHAHSAGVIHRDLKPGNIMLDEQGEPHIVDFGLAKGDGGEITITLDGQILGTPAYMSPEQARGEGHHVDRRSDVYSLGVVLFELLTGELPFRGEKQTLIEQLLNDEPPSPRQLDVTIAKDLETICLKCLEKEPAKRYGSAQLVGDDLAHFLRSEPIQARSIGRIERGWRWCRRNSKIAALSALILLLLTTAAVVSPLVALHQARLRKDRENALADKIVASAKARDATLQALLTSSTDDVNHVLHSLSWQWSEIEPLLNALLNDTTLNERQRLHIQLARLMHSPEPIPYVCERIARQETSPRELRVICQTLGEFAELHELENSIESLWRVVLDAEQDSQRKFRAACALAALDPAAEHWDSVADDLVNHLVIQPTANISEWLDMLQPIADVIREPLEEIFLSTASETERVVATTALVFLLGNNTDPIIELIKLAKPTELANLIAKLRSDPPAAVARLLEELKRERAISLLSKVHSTWRVPPDLQRQFAAADGLIAEKYAVCQSLLLDDFLDAAERLRPGGYRPTRCRPYLRDDKLLVAVTWTRDGKQWEAATKLTAEDVHHLTAENRAQLRLTPADVACYEDEEQGQWQCIAIWSEQESPEEEVHLVLMIPQNEWQATFDELNAQRFNPTTVQVFYSASKEARRCQVWKKHTSAVFSSLRSFKSLQATTSVTTGNPLYDVAIYDRDAEGLSYGSLRFRDQNIECRVKVDLRSDEFLTLCREFQRVDFKPIAIAILQPTADQPPFTACVWHRPMRSEEVAARIVREKANLAVALFHLDQFEEVLPLLKSTAVSQLRTEFLLRLAPSRANPQQLIQLLDRPDLHADVRQSLLMALGKYPVRSLAESQHAALVTRLQGLYQRDADSGVHAAAGWMLKHWLGKEPLQPESTGNAPSEKRGWYNNTFRQTLALVKVPPTSAEITKNIARAPLDGSTIAVDTHEIMQAQFLKFRPEHPLTDRSGVEKPARGVSWYEAVAFCQWLNEREGIPESQWCYFPNELGQFDEGMRIAPDFTRRKGYRLLTEREWLQAAGVGSGSDFFFGDDSDLLGNFAWTAQQARSSPATVGRFYPNFFGLFDVHGNVAEWCHDSITDAVVVPLTDAQSGVEPATELRRMIGGNFAQLPWQIQRAYARSSAAPGQRLPQTGFRIARTVVASTLDVFAEVEKAGRRGDWERVEREFELALRERPNEWAYQLIRARVRLYLGDEAGFDDICRSQSEQFKDAERRAEFTPYKPDSRIAYTIAAVWLGSTRALENLDAVQFLVQASKGHLPSAMRNQAILEYRMGNYQQAAQGLSEQAHKDQSLSLVLNLYFQAMAQQRLDRPDEALRLFNQARAQFAVLSRRVSRGEYGSRWRDWAFCSAIEREARGVLSIVHE